MASFLPSAQPFLHCILVNRATTPSTVLPTTESQPRPVSSASTASQYHHYSSIIQIMLQIYLYFLHLLGMKSVSATLNRNWTTIANARSLQTKRPTMFRNLKRRSTTASAPTSGRATSTAVPGRAPPPRWQPGRLDRVLIFKFVFWF